MSRDRKDAYLVRDLDALHVIVPYMMPNRCDNEAVVDTIVDIEAVNAYLEKKNAENPEFKYTWFHVITAALAKTIYLRPKMNRFYSNNLLYERKDVEVAFMVKRKFEDHSEESVAKFIYNKAGGSVVDQVHDYVQKIVTKVRVKQQRESTSQKMDIIKKMPRFMIALFFWVLRRLEAHGRYPDAFKKDDPCYSSVYVTNLGSIKMHANYHHIFEWGTISFFVVIDEKKMRPIFEDDGTYKMKDTIKIGLTIDERIADGYYFAKSIKLFEHILQHPELLDEPANTTIEL